MLLSSKRIIFSMEQEADLFGWYILKKAPSVFAKELYVKTISKTALEINRTDQNLLFFIYRNQWSLGLIDSGLALLTPHSEIRRRIYIIFSILECSREFSDDFLPKERSLSFMLVILFSGFRGVVKGLLGSLLIKSIARG